MNVVDSFKRRIHKLIIDPLKYYSKGDYNTAKYWQDRLSKYGTSFKGVGHEGLTETDNKRMYEKALKVFIDLCNKENLNFYNLKVLDIGCGNGFYTEFFYNQRVKEYVGVDITDILFPELRRRFPKFNFIKKDVTKERIKGKFDLILMIDVIEHIVNIDKLIFALNNVKDNLLNKGLFFVSPLKKKSKRHLFYIKWWSVDHIKNIFKGYDFRKTIPFRNEKLLIIQKND